MDKGVYYISQSDFRVGMGPPSEETIIEVYKKSNDFCKTKGNKEVQRINNIYTDSGFGKTANFALEFRCVDIGTSIPIDRNNKPINEKTSETAADKLKTLKGIFDDKLITQEEYDKKRQAILNSY